MLSLDFLDGGVGGGRVLCGATDQSYQVYVYRHGRSRVSVALKYVFLYPLVSILAYHPLWSFWLWRKSAWSAFPCGVTQEGRPLRRRYGDNVVCFIWNNRPCGALLLENVHVIVISTIVASILHWWWLKEAAVPAAYRTMSYTCQEVGVENTSTVELLYIYMT